MRNIFFGLAISLSSANAELYIWDDQKGLLPAESCESSALRTEADVTQEIELGQTLSISAMAHLSSTETNWERSIVNGQPTKLRCSINGSPKVYDIFDVYSPKESAPFRIGLNSSGLRALKQMNNLALNVLPAQQIRIPSDVTVIDGPLNFEICNGGTGVDVLDNDLSKILFQAAIGESFKLIQSFSSTEQGTAVERGFIKVQFPNRPQDRNSGWIPLAEIKSASRCSDSMQANLRKASVDWTFPTLKRPTDSYKTGQRKFSASRAGGRLHAACDLYRETNEDAVSVNSGQVIRDRYYFYQGTYAIEVKHAGGKIARYGEITGKAAPGVRLKANLQPGQTVGYVGKVNSNCCKPMLHFEFYSGTVTGPLSQPGTKYQRRKDLIDPTDLLTQWEKLKFGESF
jgi:murein DD-endopeptidase MepM/ murein hydrolase activator NlpD